MSTSEPPPPPIIEGAVVGRSAVKSLLMAIFCVLIFAFGVMLIWLKVTDTVFFADRKVTWWGLIIGILAVLVAPFMILATLHALLVRNRLIFAADRFQVVQKVKGQDEVMVQVPYANIADIKYEDVGGGRRIGISLMSLDDPATFPARKVFETNETSQGRHVVINGGYKWGLKTISDEIKRLRTAATGRS